MLVTVSRVDGYVTNLASPENSEGNIDSCITEGPYLTVKISKSTDCLSIDCNNEVFDLETRLFGGAVRGNPNDKNAAVRLFRV